MTTSAIRSSVQILFVCVLIPGFNAVNAEESATPPSAATAVDETDVAIKLNQIPVRLESAVREARRVKRMAVDQQHFLSISERLEKAGEMVNTRLRDPRLANLSQLSSRALGDLLISWRSELRNLRLIEESVTQALADATRGLERLQAIREPWERTLETAAETNVPESIQTSIRNLLSDLAAEQKTVLDFTEQLAAERISLSELLRVAQDSLERVEEGEREQRSRLFGVTAPPFWQIAQLLEVAGKQDIGGVVSDGWKIQLNILQEQWGDHADSTVLFFVVLILIFAGLKFIARTPSMEVADPSQAKVLETIQRQTLWTAWFLTTAAALTLFSTLPMIIRDLLRLMLIVPLLRIFLPLLPGTLRIPLLGLIFFYVLDGLRLAIGGHPLVDRLILLVNSTAAAAALVWLLLSRSKLRETIRDGVTWRIALLVTQGSVALLVLSTLLNLLGMLSLAALIAEGVFRLALLATAVYVLKLILNGITEAALQSRLLNTSYGIRNHHQLVRQRTDTFYNYVCATLLVITFLNSFQLTEATVQTITSLFTRTLSVGNLELSLSSAAAFVVALWVGVILSRLIRFVLQEDVFPRVQLPRGVPGAVVMLLRYGIISLAFLFALSAAGIELSKFAIVAGALGVGIGFGLQNVVNNFISGLILAFERPIQAGDVIQFGNEWGTVSVIGIRSSKVRTFDGAEIIVPNGDLISQQLTNWTLSDRLRRMEILVGVAYGTDPHRVLELLKDTAVRAESILENPPATVMFLGFGDSSLDFSLRAWTADFDNYLGVKSDLTLAVHDALDAAGIVIPFPQRDVHLRRDDVPASNDVSVD